MNILQGVLFSLFEFSQLLAIYLPNPYFWL